MNGGIVLLSDTRDRVFSSLFPPGCLLSLPLLSFCRLCLFCVLILCCLPVSCFFLVCLLLLCFHVCLLTCLHVYVLCLCCFLPCLFFHGSPFLLSCLDPLPSCPRCASPHREWLDYLLLVDHQLHFVLLAHPDWDRSQRSFGVTSRAALRGAARRP